MASVPEDHSAKKAQTEDATQIRIGDRVFAILTEGKEVVEAMDIEVTTSAIAEHAFAGLPDQRSFLRYDVPYTEPITRTSRPPQHVLHWQEQYLASIGLKKGPGRPEKAPSHAHYCKLWWMFVEDYEPVGRQSQIPSERGFLTWLAENHHADAVAKTKYHELKNGWKATGLAFPPSTR